MNILNVILASAIPGVSILVFIILAYTDIIEASFYKKKDNLTPSNLYLFIALSSEFIFRMIQFSSLRTGTLSGSKLYIYFKIPFISQVLGTFLCLFSTVYFLTFFINKLIANVRLLRVTNLVFYFSLYVYIVLCMPIQLQLNSWTANYIENYSISTNIFAQMNYFNNMRNAPIFMYSAIYTVSLQLFIIIILFNAYSHDYLNKFCHSAPFIKMIVAFELREIINIVFYFHTFRYTHIFDEDYIFSLLFYYIYAYLTCVLYRNTSIVNRKELED